MRERGGESNRLMLSLLKNRRNPTLSLSFCFVDVPSTNVTYHLHDNMQCRRNNDKRRDIEKMSSYLFHSKVSLQWKTIDEEQCRALPRSAQ